ncbi:MAG: DUF4268 domain-containing protein [Planctomycetes bacterium]|nr:DUF4268 domain-containing protein [Planctomycetota bacterium]
MKASLGQPGAVLELRIVDSKGYVAAQVRLIGSESHTVFERLDQHRRELEDRIGSPLNWDDGSGRQACTISLFKS